MKHVIFRNRTSQEHHRKMISIDEFAQDKDAKTHVRKSFLYQVNVVENGDFEEKSPEMFIQKRIDTKKQFEEFCFRTKGSFCISNGAQVVRVEFSHALKIQLHWKHKVFSPKKSVTLT